MFKEYEAYDALGLAALVKTKQVTATELLEAAVARARAVNPKINAINLEMYDYAKKNASSLPAASVFEGVPFLVKDLAAEVAGFVTSYGSKALEGVISTEDSTLVTRFKKSGLNIMGKTATPEFGLKALTESNAFGITRNPWDVSRTSGGSSGGASAAVAARIVPMASGGDGGGSIRIPAGYCGLFGLKPTRGRVPAGPKSGELWNGASIEHVLSLSVRDSAAMLDQTHGREPGSDVVLRALDQTFLSSLDTPVRKLKIGYTLKTPFGSAVDVENTAALMHTAKLLQNLGHEVEEANIDIDGDMLLNSYLSMYFGNMAADLRLVKEKYGKQAYKNTEPESRFIGLIGECYTAADFVLAKRDWFKLGQTASAYHERYDLLLTPSTAQLPVSAGSMDSTPALKAQMAIANFLGAGVLKYVKKGLMTVLYEEARKNFALTPFTPFANLTGQPSMSVPLYWSANNLPCGSMFTAPIGDELTLFQLAAQLEKVQPWFHRKPALVNELYKSLN